MTHKDLINALSAHTGESKAKAENFLKGLADIVGAQLVEQGQIILHNIGTLSVLDTTARKGRNPQTGEEIDIPAGKRIKLKAAKALKDAVAA